MARLSSSSSRNRPSKTGGDSATELMMAQMLLKESSGNSRKGKEKEKDRARSRERSRMKEAKSSKEASSTPVVVDGSSGKGRICR